MKLDWKFVNQSLNEEQKIIVEAYGKQSKLKDGIHIIECDDISCYYSKFDVLQEDLEANGDFLIFDLGYQYHIHRIDYYVNGKCIGRQYSSEETVKFLVPKSAVHSGENHFFAVVTAAAGFGINGEHYMDTEYTTELDAMPKELKLCHLEGMPEVVSVVENNDCVEFVLTNGKKAKLIFYENGIFRFKCPADAEQYVDEYCLDQLDKNIRTVSPEKIAEDENRISYSVGENILYVNLNPIRISVYDAEGKSLFIQNDEMLIGQEFGGLSVKLAEDEHIFGINENGYPHLDKRGVREDIWVCHDFDRCDVYVPYYISTAGYGFYLNSSYHSIFDMGASVRDSALLYTYTDVIDFFFISGKTPADIISGFTAITGRPFMPPKWAFGFWQAGSGTTVDTREKCETVVRRYEKENIPVDVLCLDRWHDMLGDMGWGTDRFPDPDAFMAFLKEHGMHLIAWMCPFGPTKSKNLYAEGRKKDMFMLGEDGKFLRSHSWCGFASGLMDFEKDTMQEWLKSRIKPLLEMGVAGFKLDGGDAFEVPERIVSHKGNSGKEIHNLYPLMFAKEIQDIEKEFYPNRRPITWERTGFAGSGKYPITWGGDQFANFHGTRCLVKGGQGAGLCGIPFWAQDVGGFSPHPEFDEEFFVRSYQWGVMAPLARAHGGRTEPWSFTERELKITGEFIRLRYRLVPYIYSLAYEAAKTGKPIMYPLFFFAPKDEKTYAYEYQYGFGPSLMIAPVVEKSNNSDLVADKEIYLPDGKWMDLNKFEVYEGNQILDYKVPLEMLPMFAKAGAIIPTATTPAKIADLDYSALTVYFFPGDEIAEFDFYNDEGNDISYQDGINNIIKFRCTENEITILTVSDGYDKNYEANIICRVFGERPGNVYVNGKSAEFDYDNHKKQTVFQIVYKIGEILKIELK